MRLAKPIRLMIVALGAISLMATLASAETVQATKAPAPGKAATKAPEKAATQTPAKAPAKTLAKAPAKAQPAPPAPSPTAQAAEEAKAMGGSKGRDPFDPLVNRAKPGESRIPDPGIPGPQGLVVSTVRIDGVVRTPSGMIAVLTSPQNRTYFVREGQRIYDGMVERITLDSITFRERGKDPFGNVVERPVTRRIYPRAGEQ